MKQEFADIVKHDENYKELVSKRTSFSLKLTFLMLVVYFTFILTIAYQPELLATPIYEGSVITVGIPVGVFIIFFAFVLTGIYTLKANSTFDALSKKVEASLKEKLSE